MYYITYKNILKKNKTCRDFVQWLDTFWPIQKEWGGLSVKYWIAKEGNENTLYCCYTVKNLDRWIKMATEPQSVILINALAKIVNLDRIAIKISNRLYKKKNIDLLEN